MSAGRARRRSGSAFDAPGFTIAWVSGWFWNINRWMPIFLGSFLVNDLTDSPFLVQLVGVAFFLPMLLGGPVAGVIADRFDRRAVLIAQTAYVAPAAAGLGTLVITGGIETWMVYPFLAVLGLGNAVDITARRAWLYDLAGEDRATSALSLEAVGLSMGTTLAGLVGGTVIDLMGVGEAFVLSAVFFVLAFLIILPVRAQGTHRAARVILDTSPRSDFGALLGELRRNPALVGVVGVVALVNVFFWTFPSLVPVFADDLEVGPFLTGLLASAPGFGMILGSTAVVLRRPTRGRGRLFLAGAGLAMTFLAVFALMPWYAGAFLALFVTGISIAGFTTMQSILAMRAAGVELRGRAMGMVSMAIGMAPFGMIALGLLAEGIGPSAAVTASGITGIVVLFAWMRYRPEIARLS